MQSQKSRILRASTILMATIAFAAANAFGTTYYWKPGTTQGLWTTLSNWSTEAIDGADADNLPTASDSLWGNGDYNFDLDGDSYALVNWPTPGDWNNHYLTVTNGTLAFTGEVSTHSGQINVDADGVLNLPSGSSFVPGLYSSSGMTININNGGTMSVAGSIRLYNGSFSVASGGSLTFAPSNLRFGAESHDYALTFSNAGTLSLPNGFHFDRWDTDSVDAGSTYTFTSSGTLNLGGSIVNAPSNSSSKPGPFYVVLSGGTVNVTGSDVAFSATSVTLENSVTFNVDSGKSVNLSTVAFAAGASMTKTGAGLVVLPAAAPNAAISTGGVSLLGETYDLSGVSFSAGTTIALSTLGATISASSATIGNALFTASFSGVQAGTTVLCSSVPAVLEKAQYDLASAVPSGLSLVIDGNVMSLERDSGSENTFKTSGDLLSGANWGGGAVPDPGVEVAIAGNGVVATYSAGTIPAWTSIEVKGGATLRIAANATGLPPIVLNKDATLEIANDASLTLASSAVLVGIATASQVPVLSVLSGATLNVPGGMKFSNVNISLAGTIATTSAGGLTFGYAAAGNTTYIGLSSNGGTISIIPGSGSYDTSSLQFCCPEAGGTVNAIGDHSLSLTGTTILPSYTRSGVVYPLSIDYQIGFNVGVNNPASAPFEVVFDNTTWGALGSFYVKGGATFRLANGGAYRNFESTGYWGRYAQVSENGRIVVGSGCEFRMNALGDWGAHPLDVSPTSAGHQAIVVEDGGVFETYRSSGNGRAVFSASNSVYRIYMPSLYDEHYSESSQTTTIYDTTNIPFMGFASVCVADNSTLTFSTRNKVFWDSGQFGDDSGDRVVALADVPMTGGGSIALSNDNVNVFGVVVRSGANTATGTASVVASVDGVGATTLYFADGANWAGTVTAGNVALTNLVDCTAASTNSFGALDLAAGSRFPIRVWKRGGVIVAHDGLDVTRYVNNGGKVEFVAMDEPLARGDRFAIGMIGEEEETEMPKLSRGWSAFRTPDGRLEAAYSRGFSIMLK